MSGLSQPQGAMLLLPIVSVDFLSQKVTQRTCTSPNIIFHSFLYLSIWSTVYFFSEFENVGPLARGGDGI